MWLFPQFPWQRNEFLVLAEAEIQAPWARRSTGWQPLYYSLKEVFQSLLFRTSSKHGLFNRYSLGHPGSELGNWILDGTGHLVPVESLANKTHRSSSSRALPAARRMYSSTGGGFWVLIPCEFQGFSAAFRKAVSSCKNGSAKLPKPQTECSISVLHGLQTACPCSCSSCSKSSKISPCLAQGWIVIHSVVGSLPAGIVRYGIWWVVAKSCTTKRMVEIL